MALTFEHTLPDGTYDDPGHPLHGKSLAILYAMGMLYNTTEVVDQDFQSIDDYIAYIVQYLNAAKIKYAEEMNKNAVSYITSNLVNFLRKINKKGVEVTGITTVPTNK